MKRFNFNANTIREAKNYIANRATQMLRLGFILETMTEHYWGIDARFRDFETKKEYQSLYILEQYRGQGLYPKLVEAPIITSYQCNIDEYLRDKGIEFKNLNLRPFIEYDMISKFYGDKKAKRSGLYLMNHIDEGLAILEDIGASEAAKRAYCLHPIFQSDIDLKVTYDLSFSRLGPISTDVVMATMEYRNIANAYLSTRQIEVLNDINLSPLKDVNDMLIADKIQNKKDFMLYHYGEHDRSDELFNYFNNWHDRLGIDVNAWKQLPDYGSTFDVWRGKSVTNN